MILSCGKYYIKLRLCQKYLSFLKLHINTSIFECLKDSMFDYLKSYSFKSSILGCILQFVKPNHAGNILI